MKKPMKTKSSASKELILKYLKKDKFVKLRNSNLLYKNKVIGKIENLIMHAINKRNSSHVQGLKKFYKILKNVNIPYFVIKSERGKKLLGLENLRDWKPPGKLDSRRKRKERNWIM